MRSLHAGQKDLEIEAELGNPVTDHRRSHCYRRRPDTSPLMSDILQEIGARTSAFRTADDALTHMLESSHPAPLVIVDYALPGQIQGAEFIAMVQEKWPSTGAILISGYLLEAATIPHGVKFLQKPWSMEELIESVAEVLQPSKPLRKL